MREPAPSFPLQTLPILTAQKSCDLFSEPSLVAPQEFSLFLHPFSLAFLNSQVSLSLSYTALIMHHSIQLFMGLAC